MARDIAGPPGSCTGEQPQPFKPWPSLSEKLHDSDGVPVCREKKFWDRASNPSS